MNKPKESTSIKEIEKVLENYCEIVNQISEMVCGQSKQILHIVNCIYDLTAKINGLESDLKIVRQMSAACLNHAMKHNPDKELENAFWEIDNDINDLENLENNHDEEVYDEIIEKIQIEKAKNPNPILDKTKFKGISEEEFDKIAETEQIRTNKEKDWGGK